MPWQDTKNKDKTKNLFLYKKFANVYFTVTPPHLLEMSGFLLVCIMIYFYCD